MVISIIGLKIYIFQDMSIKADQLVKADQLIRLGNHNQNYPYRGKLVWTISDDGSRITFE